MGRVLTIAWKDLRQTYRNLPALAMMLAAPLVLTLLLGVAFGGSEGFTLPQTTVVMADLDPTSPIPEEPPLGQVLRKALQSEGLRDLVKVERRTSAAEARAAVDAGDATVAVIVPKGLTASLLGPGATSAGGPSLLVYRDPSAGLQAGVVTSVVQRLVDEVSGAWAAAGTAVHASREAGVTDQQALLQLAGQAQRRYLAISQGNPVLVSAREPQVPGAVQKEPGVTAQVLPGMMIFFMFIAAMNTARGILEEDRAGTLPRLFTTPTPRSVILAGKFTSVLAVVLVQTAILLAAGALVFRIEWGKALPVLALSLVGAAASAGLAVFVLSFLKTPAQAGALSTGVVIILALLGGNFVGGVDWSGPFAVLRRLTPNGWLLIAWGTTLRGGSLLDVLLPVLVVGLFAVVTFAAGAVLFVRRYA